MRRPRPDGPHARAQPRSEHGVVRRAEGRPGQAARSCRPGHGFAAHAPIRARPTPTPSFSRDNHTSRRPRPSNRSSRTNPRTRRNRKHRHAAPGRSTGLPLWQRHRARPSQDSGSLGRTHYPDPKSRILPTTRTAPHRHTRPTARYRAVSVAVPDPHPHAQTKPMRMRPGAHHRTDSHHSPAQAHRGPHVNATRERNATPHTRTQQRASRPHLRPHYGRRGGRPAQADSGCGRSTHTTSGATVRFRRWGSLRRPCRG
jgi:hypothetical protein